MPVLSRSTAPLLAALLTLPALPALSWEFAYTTSTNSKKCAVTSAPMPSGNGADTLTVTLQFGEYYERYSDALLAFTSPDLNFTEWEEYDVTIRSTAQPSQVAFRSKVAASQPKAMMITDIDAETNSEVQQFMRAISGTADAEILVETGVGTMGPFLVDVAALRAVLPEFAACLDNL